jgi:hypothetical protein
MSDRVWLKRHWTAVLFVCLLAAIVIFRAGPIRQKTYWINDVVAYKGYSSRLVCSGSGRAIIEISLGDVKGADGVDYGSFPTQEQAKDRAKEIANSYRTFWFGHSALRCP